MIPTVTILLFFIDSAEETGTNDMSFSDRLQVTKSLKINLKMFFNKLPVLCRHNSGSSFEFSSF